jgi:hypothetical protein
VALARNHRPCPKPKSMTDDPDKPKPPDLHEWIARYGGYTKIDWEAWDRAMEEYQSARRTILEGERRKLR